MIGKTIAHYKFLEKLGAGGMGEVYQAEDLSLNRHVAIKVLPDLFAADPERLARFEREAKILASLNHPNIAAIYGVEEAAGKRFLILELVEGETLEERLSRTPLSLEESAHICGQIAEGLETAHEKGIIHRDLKPSNVKITPEGKVKILDFGLARAYHDQISEVDLVKSPTITAAMTQPGVILGTAAYMSPEQAKGKTVDKRADIWGFGCILFECLTGIRPFQGETITETLAAILKGEPNWETLPPETPGAIRRLLRHCLIKDRGNRLHDISDARIELVDSDAQSEMPPASGERRLRMGWVFAGMAAMLIIGAAVAGWVVRANSPQPKPDGVVKSAINVEPGYWLDGLTYGLGGPTRTAMAITPDGKSVIYGAIVQNPAEDAKAQLFSRPIDQLEAKPIPGTKGGTMPFLSPDGRWLGFWAEEELRAVPIEGGDYRRLCRIGPAPFGFSWGPDGTIAFADQEDSGIFKVSADGGKPDRLTQRDPAKGEYGHRLPSWLPNGKALLFTIAKQELDQHPLVAVLRLDTGAWRPILDDASDARYVPTGHLVFARLGKLMAVPFALDTLEPNGPPTPIIANVRQALNTFDSMFGCGAAQFSFSNSGSLLYAEGGVFSDSRIKNRLVWVDQKGDAQPASPGTGPNWGARISPDDKKLAVSRFSGKTEIDIIDFKRGVPTPILRPGATGAFPLWTPHGDRLVFSSLLGTYYRLCAQAPEPNAPVEKLSKTPDGRSSQYASSWAPDGKSLAFVDWRPGNCDVLLLDTETGQVTPLLAEPYDEWYPEFSPDGEWLAYVSNKNNTYEVWARSFPGQEKEFKISLEDGFSPMWSRDGKQLFYRRYHRRWQGRLWPNEMWVVDVKGPTDDPFGTPRLLFDKPGYWWAWPVRGEDLGSDGRFLMSQKGEDVPDAITQMVLVQNWFEELKRLCPPGKK